MPRPDRTFLLPLLLAGCATYAPDPVDVADHARAFAARLPDADAILTFAQHLRQWAPAVPVYDPTDGLDHREGALLVLLLAPELRALRQQAGVTKAMADHAGRLADPVLAADFARILEHVDHPWLAGGALGITLPWTGRAGAATDAADAEHRQQLLAVRTAEAAALDDLDRAWARWSHAGRRAELLDDLLTRLRDLEAIATRLEQAQEVTRLFARVFTLERLSREDERLQATAAAETLRLQLLARLGLPPTSTVVLHPRLMADDRAGAPASRQERALRGPLVQTAQAAHDVAEHQLELAIAEQWPELTLLPGFAEEDAQPRARLGFSLPLPLWNRNAAAIAAATATRDRRREQVQGAVEQVVTALAVHEHALAVVAERQQRLAEHLLPAAARQAEDGRRLAELGELDAPLLLDTLLRAHQAKSMVLDVALAAAEATIDRNALFWPQLTTTATEEER